MLDRVWPFQLKHTLALLSLHCWLSIVELNWSVLWCTCPLTTVDDGTLEDAGMDVKCKHYPEETESRRREHWWLPAAETPPLNIELERRQSCQSRLSVLLFTARKDWLFIAKCSHRANGYFLKGLTTHTSQHNCLSLSLSLSLMLLIPIAPSLRVL